MTVPGDETREWLRSRLADVTPGHLLAETVDRVFLIVAPIIRDRARITNEANLLEEAGARTCADSVRTHAESLGLAPPVIEYLLQEHLSAEQMLRGSEPKRVHT